MRQELAEIWQRHKKRKYPPENLRQEYNGQAFLPSLHSFLQKHGDNDEAPEDGSRDEQDYGEGLLPAFHEGGNT
jgi:hypothetical protein